MVDRLYSLAFAMAVWSTVATHMITWGVKKRPPLEIPLVLSNSMFRELSTQDRRRLRIFRWLTVASADNETTLRDSLSYLDSKKRLNAIWPVFNLGL
jgi:hypothetical protein